MSGTVAPDPEGAGADPIGWAAVGSSAGRSSAGADDGASTDPGWLLLVYRVPTEPTRLRAAVWRRLKALGAIYLQGSVAAVPATISTERALRALRHEISADMGGSAVLFRAGALAGGLEVSAAFNAARDEEYTEFVERCESFRADLDKHTAAEHFTYAVLEESDDGLTKLRKWLEKVRGRDLLAADHAQVAAEHLERCGAALAVYADRVYQVDTTQPAIKPVG